jgi:periplasmic protein TonB
VRKSKLVKSFPYIAIGIGLLLVLLLAFYAYQLVLNGKQSGKKAVVQQITIITPPPPPPPPPEEEPEEIEPEEVEEIEEIPETPPEQAMDEVAGQDLGLDTDGGAGTDGFGLIGRKGGTGLGLGKAGHYEVMIKEKLHDLVSSDDELGYLNYTATIKVWIKPSGEVDRFSIQLEEESSKVRKRLEHILKNARFNSGPPAEIAEKAIKYRINSRV